MSQTSPPAGRPGGYNRSFGGLVGAMIVMVVAVVLIWLALGLFRDEAEFEPAPIDYDASMTALAENGAALAYPERLPEGWRVNNLAYDPADPSFSLALLTDDERFVGVYHGREDLEELLERLVDDSVEEDGTVELTDGGGEAARGPPRHGAERRRVAGEGHRRLGPHGRLSRGPGRLRQQETTNLHGKLTWRTGNNARPSPKSTA